MFSRQKLNAYSCGHPDSKREKRIAGRARCNWQAWLTVECSTVEPPGNGHNAFVFILIQPSKTRYFGSGVQHRELANFFAQDKRIGRLIFKDLDSEFARKIHRHRTEYCIL
jgi:hypothetical protein